MSKLHVVLFLMLAVLVSGAQLQPMPQFTLTHNLKGYFRDKDLEFSVDGDILRLKQLYCDKRTVTATTAANSGNPPVGGTVTQGTCPTGCTCQPLGNGVFSANCPNSQMVTSDCTDPELTLGKFEDMERFQKDLQMVMRAWSDKRRIEAMVSSKYQ